MLAAGVVALAVGGGLRSNITSVEAAKASLTADDGNGQEISASALQQINALIAEKESRTAIQRKIDSQLLFAIKMARGEPVATNVQTLSVNVPTDSDGRLVVDIIATVNDTLLAGLRANGARIIASVPNFRSVRAELSLDKVEAIAAYDEVYFIRPKLEAMTSQADPQPISLQSLPTRDDLPASPDFARRVARVQAQLSEALSQQGVPAKPIADIGTRNSEGDVTHKARDARNAYGFDGTGIKIGVLSDGVTSLAGAQKSGDLGAVTILPGQEGGGDEGTAMLEIVHDLAPGAQLFFATAFNGPASFAQNILDLRAAGCDIIVDDVSYTSETPFQDGQAPSVISNTLGGVITQAVNDVTASGALYFSSAGNSGNKNDNTAGVWEGDFLDGGPLPLLPGGAAAGTVHDFDSVTAGTQSNQITLAGSLQYNLFWSDPLGGSNNDYDLFVLNAGSTAVVTSSTNIQDGTQDPWEPVSPTAAGTRLVVRKATGAATRFLHLTTNRGRLAISTSGTIRGHCISADAYAVAATPAGPSGGTNPNGPFPGPFTAANSQVESFSSDGPRRIFFNPSGTAYTPGNFLATGGLLRQKPDITAADGVSVTGTNNFTSVFFGTSAAAPHAAAIAGLLKSANTAFTPAQIRTFLTTSAIDMETAGVDRDSGAGNIMALEAMQAALGAATTAANLELGTVAATESTGNGNVFVEPGENGQLVVQLTNPGTAAATSVTATLTTTTPGVNIGTANSAYPDIAPAGSANNTTPFIFALDSSADCLTHVEFTLTVNYAGGPSPRVFSFTIETGQQAVISTVLDVTAPPSGSNFTASTGTQTNRLFRTAPASSCSATKPNPGLSAATNPRFDRYQFTNTNLTQSMCVSVNLAYNASILTQNQLQSVAFSPAFNPAAPSTNYVGDAGASVAVQDYSFKVSPNTTFDVVVNDPLPGNAATGLGMAYTLRVYGLACAAAPANLPPANTVPGAQTTNENTPLVFSSANSNQISVTDPDAGGNPLKVTLSVTNGTLTLNGTVGLSFTAGDGVADATMTFTGTQTAINTALNGLTFNPTPGFAGTGTQLTITTDDQGFTGSGGALSDTDTVNITVNPGGTLQFTSATYNVNEAGPTAIITVTRAGGSSGSASVTFNVSDGTAVQGQDYTSPATGTLTFVDGDTSETFTITITDDALAESDETVNLTLSNVTGTATLGSPAAAVLTIVDNDRVEFENPTYTIEEGCTAVSVTVTRTGNISSPASVNYATADGTASARSDYTPASGRLEFAAGEITKTIQILISEDSHVEGTETFSVVLSNAGAPSGDVVSSAGSTTVVSITDDATEPSTNAIDDTAIFVCQQYHDFLNREPDPDGLAFWVGNIDSCATAACKADKRIETSAAFFLSIEFQQTGYAIYLAHQAAFAGSPVPVTLEDFLPDVQRIGRGVIIGQPGALALLEANTVAYFNEFVTRPEFTTQYPSSMTPAQFVDELNSNSGGSLSPSERNALVAELTANNTTAGRASVLRKVTDDSTFRAAEFNRAFVLMQYFGYLRRNPNDTPDTDYGGYFFWLNKLDSFNGDFRGAEMVKAFITSAEYRQRFGTN